METLQHQKESFLEIYRSKHQHPVNQVLHSIGIPAIVVSIPLFFFHWRWALGLFIAGWVFQIVGHIFEGNQPAFLKNPIYLIVGPIWWVKKLFQKNN